jgi:hypothetical protein
VVSGDGEIETKTVTIGSSEVTLERRVCVGGCGNSFWVKPSSKERSCSIICRDGAVPAEYVGYLKPPTKEERERMHQVTIDRYERVVEVLEACVEEGFAPTVKDACTHADVPYGTFMTAKHAICNKDPKRFKRYDRLIPKLNNLPCKYLEEGQTKLPIGTSKGSAVRYDAKPKRKNGRGVDAVISGGTGKDVPKDLIDPRKPDIVIEQPNGDRRPLPAVLRDRLNGSPVRVQQSPLLTAVNEVCNALSHLTPEQREKVMTCANMLME